MHLSLGRGGHLRLFAAFYRGRTFTSPVDLSLLWVSYESLMSLLIRDSLRNQVDNHLRNRWMCDLCEKRPRWDSKGTPKGLYQYFILGFVGIVGIPKVPLNYGKTMVKTSWARVKTPWTRVNHPIHPTIVSDGSGGILGSESPPGVGGR